MGILDRFKRDISKKEDNSMNNTYLSQTNEFVEKLQSEVQEYVPDKK